MPGAAGIVLPMADVILGLAALTRLRTALWINHRYRFTTWRWGRVAVVLMLIGVVMKFAFLWR